MTIHRLQPQAVGAFFDSKHIQKYPKNIIDVIASIKELHNAEYIENGLLKIDGWLGDVILMDVGLYFLSEELKTKLLSEKLVDNVFLPIAFGWAIDPSTEVLKLPIFYMFNGDISVNSSKDLFIKDKDLYCSNKALDIINKFDCTLLKVIT